MSAGPLGPRESALGLWTGREALIVGGSDAPPCPPNAGCSVPDVPPLADGAAYDPRARVWREIADSPVPFEWAQAVVIGGTAYIWVPGNPARPGSPLALLAYRIDEDLWAELPPPPTDEGASYRLVAAGERPIAYSGGDELGERPDLVFDPETSSWSELPPDPLSPGFDRVMAWSDRELFLFDHELVANPGSEEGPPLVTRVASFHLETGSWKRLPDAGADPHPLGLRATVDGQFVLSPVSVDEPSDGSEDTLAGVLTASEAVYFGRRGKVLDATTGSWLEMPELTEDHVSGQTVVDAGRDLLAFGGARWGEGDLDGELLADAWIWMPRGAGEP